MPVALYVCQGLTEPVLLAGVRVVDEVLARDFDVVQIGLFLLFLAIQVLNLVLGTIINYYYGLLSTIDILIDSYEIFCSLLQESH